MPSVLRSPRLRRILAAYTVNRLGTWIGAIALSLVVFSHTHSALAVAATLVAGQVVPALLVPAVVARVEASKRSRELSGLYLFEAIATSGLVVLVSSFSLVLVLLLVALDGIAALTASALLRAELARAGREELRALKGVAAGGEEALEREANAALNVCFSATFVLGPVLGGTIAARWALSLDAVSFLLCALLLADLHPDVQEAAEDSGRARLAAAWGYIRSSPALARLLVTEAVVLVFFEAAAPIEVAYAKVTLHAGGGGFGLLVTMWGIGVVAGSILFARAAERRLGPMILAATLAVGLAYIGFALAPSLAVACVAALLGGVGNGTQWAPLISAVQGLTPPEMQGRVMGALESIGALAPAVGLTLGGGLVAVSSPRTAFALVGAGAALSTIAFARLRIDREAPRSHTASAQAPAP